MIGPSLLRRCALVSLLAAAAAPLVGCEASVSTSRKPEDSSGWEEPPTSGPSNRQSLRAVSGRPPTATYPGYHVVDEDRRTSVVVVEVSRQVDVREVRESSRRFVYVLSGTNVPEKVNRLPLVADHFGTVVKTIHLEQAGADAHLVIETRGDAAVTHRVAETDNGINVEVRINGEPVGWSTEARQPYERKD